MAIVFFNDCQTLKKLEKHEEAACNLGKVKVVYVYLMYIQSYMFSHFYVSRNWKFLKSLFLSLSLLVNCFKLLRKFVFQMSEKIKSLEEELLEEKPWQLRGEVTGHKRPENSLLEETVLFDHAVRMGKY